MQTRAVAQRTASREEAWRFQLRPGPAVDVLDTVSKWCEAQVLCVAADSVLVHFRGWSKTFDEWLPLRSPRLALPYSHVRPWRDLKVGDRVEVRKKWQKAEVIGVQPSKGPGFPSKAHVQIAGRTKSSWVSTQDEYLCADGTHTSAAPIRDGTQPPADAADRVKTEATASGSVELRDYVEEMKRKVNRALGAMEVWETNMEQQRKLMAEWKRDLSDQLALLGKLRVPDLDEPPAKRTRRV